VETKRALRRGLENPVDSGERIAETRAAALVLLAARNLAPARAETLWQNMGDDYFLRETAEDIAWHTEAILGSETPDGSLVLLKESGNRFDAVTQIFIYTLDRDNLFAVITATMEQLGLNVHGARVYSSADHHTLDTFFVLDLDGKPVRQDSARCQEIRRSLLENLRGEEQFLEIVQRHTPRALKHFRSPTRTRLVADTEKGYSMLEVMTPDRSGLLARIGRVFLAFGIKVQNARITTLGERVEDVFFITDANQQPIEDPSLAASLQQAICDALDTEVREPERISRSAT
jgi:[protein-PII] uridylyltransferase